MKKLIMLSGVMLLSVATFFAVKKLHRVYKVATDFSDLNFDDIDWDCT